jgi:hypothetical protein
MYNMEMKRRVMVQEAAASLIIYHRVGYRVYKVLKAPRVITSPIGTKKSNAPYPNEKKKNRSLGNACT